MKNLIIFFALASIVGLSHALNREGLVLNPAPWEFSSLGWTEFKATGRLCTFQPTGKHCLVTTGVVDGAPAVWKLVP